MTRAAGARIHAFSTEFGSGWVAENLIPADERVGADDRPVDNLVWSSGSNAPFPHWITIDLGGAKWLTTFVFNNALEEEPDHPGISARLLELHAGNTPDELQLVATFELERNRSSQAVTVSPVQARYVKFLIRSNWGHPWYTELGASAAFDDGSRPGALASTLESAGRLDLRGVYFDFGRAEIRPESARALDELAAFLTTHATVRMRVEGHTDDRGPSDLNDRLSASRAQAVLIELQRRGVAADRLEARGYGASRPVASNADDVGRARNRRVTVQDLARERGATRP